jgi:putative membrane protein
MTWRSLALLSSAAVTLASCGERSETPANAASPSVNASTAIAHPQSAQELVDVLASNDRFVIESATFIARSHSEEIKAFAGAMIAAHKASTEELQTRAAAMKPPVTVNTKLNADQRGLLNTIGTLRGAVRDSAFVRAQVSAHATTLRILESYATSGESPELRQLASRMVRLETAHLTAAQDFN